MVQVKSVTALKDDGESESESGPGIGAEDKLKSEVRPTRVTRPVSTRSIDDHIH